MPYNVRIQNFDGLGLAGSLLLFDAIGEQIGEAHISSGGSTLTDDDLNGADHIRVTAPGYNYYGTTQLYDDNLFTLSRKPPIVLYAAVGALAGMLLQKFLKILT